MKRIIVLLAFTCAFSISALAGQIPSDGLTSTTPDGTEISCTLHGEIPSVGSSYEIADAALDLIQMFIGIGV